MAVSPAAFHHCDQFLYHFFEGIGLCGQLLGCRSGFLGIRRVLLDGLIELGGNTVDFFTSSKGWLARNSTPPTDYDYAYFLGKAGTTTPLTTDLISASGAYLITGDFEIDNQSLPNDYDNLTFDQIVFVDGNLTITTDIQIDPTSTALFIVSGNIHIDKKVNALHVGLFSDQEIATAHNITEGEATDTLILKGIYAAETFSFQRTLQGTNNQKDPSDDFTYEPKYLIQLRDFFGENHIIWRSVN